MPSPESPAKRMITRSSCWTCLADLSMLRPVSPDASQQDRHGLVDPFSRQDIPEVRTSGCNGKPVLLQHDHDTWADPLVEALKRAGQFRRGIRPVEERPLHL